MPETTKADSSNTIRTAKGRRPAGSERGDCIVTSESEWYFLALIGTPGKVFSANSPRPERTLLGRKSQKCMVLCRQNRFMSTTLRPMIPRKSAHSSARDVSRSEARGQNGIQPDRTRSQSAAGIVGLRKTEGVRLKTGPSAVVVGVRSGEVVSGNALAR